MFDEAFRSPLDFFCWYWEPLVWLFIIFPLVYFQNKADERERARSADKWLAEHMPEYYKHRKQQQHHTPEK